MKSTARALMFLAIALNAPSLAASDIVTVSFPGLCERYEGRWTIRDTLAFELDRVPVNIYSASIRIVGESYPALCYCDFWSPIGLAAWRFSYKAILDDAESGGSWEAWFVTSTASWRESEIEPFDMTLDLSPSDGATWAFIAGGAGELIFEIIPTGHCYGASCYSVGLPAVRFSEVSLIVEADFLDGLDYSSWGAIKALFRPGP